MCSFVELGLVFHTKPRDWLVECLRNDIFCMEWDVNQIPVWLLSTPRLYDWSVSSEHLCFLFLVFFISLFCCDSVRQIKLAIR